jgi:hypothetical protein
VCGCEIGRQGVVGDGNKNKKSAGCFFALCETYEYYRYTFVHHMPIAIQSNSTFKSNKIKTAKLTSATPPTPPKNNRTNATKLVL